MPKNRQFDPGSNENAAGARPENKRLSKDQSMWLSRLRRQFPQLEESLYRMQSLINN
ncbi:MAG: hypothetical protein AAFP69_17375 [Planctomycetota bacterium]